MPVAPLFIPDIDTLKSRVRLTGATNLDTSAAIDSALHSARYLFFDNLGSTRISEILGFPRNDNPSTANELIRSKAESAEAVHVRMTLMRTIPTFFLDASNQASQRWNEEALFRSSGNQLDSEIERLGVEFLELLTALKGESSEEASGINVGTIGPAETPPLPGASIWGVR